MKSFCCFIVLLILLWLPKAKAKRNDLRSFSVDATFEQGASGEEVVESCIQKIDNLQTFDNDYQLLKRVSLVESNFGQNISSAATQNDRGIWQISSFLEQAISNISEENRFRDQVEALQSLFPSGSLDFENLDLTVPLECAAAVRLFIHATIAAANGPGLSRSIQTLEEQELWWQVVFNRGTSSANFSAIVENYESNLVCNNEMLDLWFSVDGSGSISQQDFETSLEFVKTISQRLVLGPNNVKIGLAVYGENQTTFSDFSINQTNSEFEQLVDSISYTPQGESFTGGAITHAIDYGFSDTGGARPISDGVPRILVIITDGMSDDDVVQPALRAHQEGITVFSIGVGPNVEEDELNEIASDPDSSHAFLLDDFDELFSAITPQLVEDFCEAPVNIPVSASIDVNVNPGSTQYFMFEVPQTSFSGLSCTPSSNSLDSNGVIYIGSLPQPSSVLYDTSSPINGLNPVDIEVDFESFDSPLTSNQEDVEVYCSVSCNANETNDLIFTISLGTTSTSIEPIVIVPITNNAVDDDIGLIIGIVIGSLLALLLCIILGFCLVKKFCAKSISPTSPSTAHQLTEIVPEENRSVQNELQTFITDSKSIDKVDLKFMKNFEDLLISAEISNAPSSQIRLAQIQYSRLFNTMNQVNQLKTNLQTALRGGKMSEISSALAASKSLKHLKKWKLNDPELALLLNKSDAAIHQNSGTTEEKAIKKQEAKQGLVSTLEDSSSKRFDFRLSTFTFEVSLPKVVEGRTVDDVILLDNAKWVMQEKSKIELQSGLTKALKQQDIIALTAALDAIDYALEDGSLFIINPEFQTEISHTQAALTKLQEAETAKLKILKLDQPLIAELKSYNIPLEVVNSVMKATFILLGEKPASLANWKLIQNQIGQLGKKSLKRRVFECKPEKITTKQAVQANSCIKNLTISQVMTQSRTAATFLDWCESTIRAVDVRNTKTKALPTITQSNQNVYDVSFDQTAETFANMPQVVDRYDAVHPPSYEEAQDYSYARPLSFDP